jgi:hypothetical protein
VHAKVKALPTDTATLCVSGHAWEHWGAAPYAANRTEAMAKLGNALDAMVTCGLMPKAVADAFRADDFKIIRDNPDGITTTPGKHAYLTPETHLDGMMTGGTNPHLMTNVTVSKTVIGKGQVKAAEAVVWSLMYTDPVHGTKTYTLVMPFTCFNWSLMTFDVPIPALPPPPTKSPCYIIRTTVHAGDRSEQFGALGPDVPSEECWKVRIVGKTDWIPLSRCKDAGNCFQALALSHDMRLGKTAQVDVPDGCESGCAIEWSVPREFAESANNMAELCDVRKNGQGSCGVMVRFDDYHSEVATIFYDYETVPVTWKSRKLYWRFETDPKNCKRFYRK